MLPKWTIQVISNIIDIIQYYLQKNKLMSDKTYCPENYPHFGYYPSLNLYLPQESYLFQQIIEIQNHFEKEMTEMRQQSSRLMRTVLDLKMQLEQTRRSKKKAKTQKIKKFYKKDRACEFQGCDKKYSSQIALNAHIKKVHRKKEEDSSQYVV